MKINKFKGITIGMLIGGSLMFSYQSFASIKIEAAFAKFNIVIDGQAKELQTNPLVVDGTSYLPVRNMANLFGYDVTYNEVSRTIELNIPKPNVNLPVLTGEDAIFYSQKDIFAKSMKSYSDPHMLVGAKKGKIVVIYNGEDYYPETNLNYFYDPETDTSYFSKTFLLQFFKSDFFNQMDEYSIDFTKKIAIKNNS